VWETNNGAAGMKWPRQYAALIKKMPRELWREAILNDVPDYLQDFVRKHLRNHVERLKYAEGTARQRYLDNKKP